MTVQLFDDFDAAVSLDAPATNEFLELLMRLRHAAETETPSWAAYPAFQEFARTCLWGSRKLEYSFAVEALAGLEAGAGRSLRVLDVGCGVSPFCNWAARRGHEVTAIDRSVVEIEFLIENDLSAFYGSAVDYRVDRSEQLAFADGTFDLVTCLSVLSHMPPGNDRLALTEMARVLRQDGHLVATFAVTPGLTHREERPAQPSRVRGYAEPFSPRAMQTLLGFVEQMFNVSGADVPQELATLTWSTVNEFWRASQRHDDRSEVSPEYLVAGAFLQRSHDFVPPDANWVEAALLEGQAAYEERLEASTTSSGVIEPHQVTTEETERAIAIAPSGTGLPESGVLRLDRNTRTIDDGTMLSARLSVLAEQERAIEAYLRCRRGEGAWQWIAPKLGVLSQHAPTPASIPDHYHLLPRMPSSPPTIAIVTPTLNQGTFLERTLNSVLDQRYPGLEYVVQDGASSDETLDILSRFGGRLSHHGSAKDGGFAEALNTGFQHTTGEILAYLNSDDVLLPGALHFVAAFFSANPDVDAVYSHRLIIDTNDAEIGRWILPAHDDEVMPWRDFVPQETLFWRRRLWDRVGAEMDESFQFAVDWELLLRFRRVGAKFARLPRFLGAFRIHPQQKTSQQMEDVGEAEIHWLRKHYLGHAVSDAEVEEHVQPFLRRHVVYHRLYGLGVLRY